MQLIDSTQYKITMKQSGMVCVTMLAEMTKEELQALIAAASARIESQEQPTRESFRFADHEEAMKLFYEQIEPQ